MPRSPEACVKRYLLLVGLRPPTTTDLAKLRRRLEAAEEEARRTRDALERVHLRQRVLDLQHEIEQVEYAIGDFAQIEEEFIDHVRPWAHSKRVSYAALREAGVSAAVLRRAGMKPR